MAKAGGRNAHKPRERVPGNHGGVPGRRGLSPGRRRHPERPFDTLPEVSPRARTVSGRAETRSTAYRCRFRRGTGRSRPGTAPSIRQGGGRAPGSTRRCAQTQARTVAAAPAKGARIEEREAVPPPRGTAALRRGEGGDDKNPPVPFVRRLCRSRPPRTSASPPRPRQIGVAALRLGRASERARHRTEHSGSAGSETRASLSASAGRRWGPLASEGSGRTRYSGGWRHRHSASTPEARPSRQSPCRTTQGRCRSRLRIADCGLRIDKGLRIWVFQSAIRNPESAIR